MLVSIPQSKYKVGDIVSYKERNFKKIISEKEFPAFKTPLNYVRTLADDHEGNMYIGTQYGLMRLKYKDWTLDTFSVDTGMKTLLKERITDILIKPKEIWVSTSPGAATSTTS